MKKARLFSTLTFCGFLTTASQAALVSTWTADAAPLGNPPAGTVVLAPVPVVNTTGGVPLDFSVSANAGVTDFTDVISLSAAHQTQLAGAGLSVTQGLDNVRGATRKLVGASFDALGNLGSGANVTRRDVTFDMFYSPDRLNDVSQLLFETGGSGAGTSLNMNGNTLTLGVAENAGTAVNTMIDLSAIYAAVPDTTDYLQIRLGLDLTNNLVTLSALNLGTGLSTTSSTAFTGNDWAGADGTGFFNTGGATAGGSAGGNVPGGYSNFDGQFAGFQFYADEVLAPIPEPSSASLIGLAAGLLIRRRRR